LALVAAASGVVSARALDGLQNAAARLHSGSAAIQIVYYLALAQAYRFGDLSHVYAIARRRSAADGDADHALGLLRASAAAHWRV